MTFNGEQVKKVTRSLTSAFVLETSTKCPWPTLLLAV